MNGLNKYPEFLKSHHLVELGIFPHVDAVYVARFRGKSPDYVRVNRKILYPKESVIQWIQDHWQSGKTPLSVRQEKVVKKGDSEALEDQEVKCQKAL